MTTNGAAYHTPSWPLAEIVRQVRSVSRELEGARRHQFGQRLLPSRETIETVVSGLRTALFPAHFGSVDPTDNSLDYFVGHTLDTALVSLHEQIRRAFLFLCEDPEHDCGDCEKQAISAAETFAIRLPDIRKLLGTDVHAAFDGDPAATNVDEVISCYPGVEAITHHRLAHELYRLGVPMIPRIISEISHGRTGIDIHPGASIGASFFIDHGSGVVIGETSVIGQRVRLYQGVTLGAKKFPLDDRGRPIKGLPRHPIIEDDVVIYAGATILGRITIGRGSSIGGNVWLTHSVAPFSRVTQAEVQSDVFEGGAGI